MANTSVPSITFGTNGIVVPTESQILAGVQADYNAAFGGGLNASLDTPQGQLASSQTAIIADGNDQFQFYINQVDPAFASGRMQDGIGRIYFIERKAALPTTVVATCVGLAGTVIPIGTLAQATDGNLYSAAEEGTIGSGGSVDISFACTITGPIACPANSLTRIYRAVPGWDTINNATEGVLGNLVESRADFEARRRASVALNARNTLNAIRAAVLDVPNVLDAYVTDNSTASPVTKGGVTLPAYVLYVAVSGGDAQAVAEAIFSKKPPGQPYYAGNTTQTVYDTNAGYSPPLPAYSVTFEDPAALPIKFAIQIENSTAVPSDATTQIQAAIISAFAGGDGGSRARIGSTIYALRYVAPIAALGAWAQVVSLQIGTTTANQNTVDVNIDKVPTVAASDISVTYV